ncbi:low specificity L-threonine aldolase [Patulibacter sp. SYSU D01012]|uniref:threonine aldolase family protein n=1 Tax=Patulibacter sp. SYSU D01012 TaxID=2817381 RepID=UPI001B300C81|nr:low specificity L-threonine aldolase [Patulibacter sp. SYSU D01012]
MKGFASDNYAGVHPEVLTAIAEANDGHAVSYGEDPWTARAEELFRAHFGDAARSWLVFNGTGANVLAYRALCRPWQAVICSDTAHVHVDEAGAPERVAGTKLLTVATPDGKLTPELVDTQLQRVGDEHAPQPGLVSVTQSTELGTRYSVDELRALADHAHAHGLLLHIDGSRLSNAAAGLDVPLRAISTDIGADALSFGGTKNGLLGAEAVVMLHDGVGDGMAYLRKQTLQLASKQRFVAAQMIALLEGDLWRSSAAHANAMATRLADAMRGIPGVELTQRVEANAVFALVPPGVADELRRDFRFYTWDEATGEVRWMCSFDTTEDEVDAFAGAVERACGAAVGA